MSQFTELLQQAKTGDNGAEAQLLSEIYRELRSVAARLLRRESKAQTFQPTALLHEAYLRLSGEKISDFKNKQHYVGIAAKVMRQILVDHARSKNAEKRGSGQTLCTYNDQNPSQQESWEVLALHEALEKLAKIDERQAKIVELRYFGGLEIEECARSLEISPATVKREILMARAWLHRELFAGDSVPI